MFQFPVLYRIDLKQSEAGKPKLEENMNLLETFLTRTTYVAGEELTIADLAILANVSSVDEGAGLDLSRWPHVSAWLAKLKAELPYYEQATSDGNQTLGELYRTSLKEMKAK